LAGLTGVGCSRCAARQFQVVTATDIQYLNGEKIENQVRTTCSYTVCI
jgi:hypothetical protein